MYPRGADLYGTNLPRRTYENGQFDEQIIHNGVDLFVDAVHEYFIAY